MRVAGRARSSGPMPSGIRASRSASTPQGPGCSTSRKERTVDAVPVIDSLRSSLAAAQRKLTKAPRSSRYDPEQPLANQPPGQHQPALLVEWQVARPQLGAAAHLLQRGPDPGGHLEDPVAQQDLQPVVALRHEHAGVARAAPQQSVVVDRVEDEPVDQRALEPRGTRAEEPAYLLLEGCRRVDLAQAVGDVGEMPAELMGQRLRVVEVAGRQMARRDLGAPASSTPARPGRAR